MDIKIPSIEIVTKSFSVNFVYLGRDADLMVMVNCQIPSDDLIVHFF
ncbi:Uncharacterised protein [Serratia liquefaciens]|nr:Uncharacterised protein [Serratia liquefaciens]